MGEFIRHNGEEIKIGTLENLYYTSYGKYTTELKAGRLSPDGSTSPESYALPDSGFRFRFPFPDEDKLAFGEIIGPWNRGIPITIEQAAIPDPGLPGSHYQM
jgi:hypothetical protein